MKYIPRSIETMIQRTISRGKSLLLLGPRQTGKTTLIKRMNPDLYISFIVPDIRQRYEKAPHVLIGEVEALPRRGGRERPLVIMDEVQKVPGIMDSVQDLIDRGIADFILTGSSVRKLRRGAKINLLPGRIVTVHSDPFTLQELAAGKLEDRLIYGSLPGILAVPDLKDRERDLESYVTTYLEEEVRAEAAVRQLGDFARFLELAAAESGQIVNHRKLSQEIGVAHTTIASYYQILEDCLIVERVEPLTKSKTRKKLTKSCKYIFFDLGVRRIAAREGIRPPREQWGSFFEQFIGLELIRCIRALPSQPSRLKFWRDPDGPEVDWVIENPDCLIPIEVKWTETPQPGDIRHLQVFLREYPESREAYVICRAPRKIKLGERIYALPWRHVVDLIG
ncbi:MAG: ATP-binding protein [Candidatus Omnitrophota bacterium]